MSGEVTSLGGLGISYRSDSRIYWSADSFVDDLDSVGLQLERFLSLPIRYSNSSVSRSVFRAVFSREAVDQLSGHQVLCERAEVLIPASNDEDSYLVYLASNTASRVPLGKTAIDLRDKVVTDAHHCIRGHDTIEMPEEFSMISAVDTSAEELNELWGKTFKWDRAGCESFLESVEKQKVLASADRTRWFSGVIDSREKLVSCAMAERLDIPSKLGSLALIENTEWSTSKQHRGQGLNTFVVRDLNKQIELDLANVNHITFAECNVSSGAHKVAFKSGFKYSSILIGNFLVPQILLQNVAVGDGSTNSDRYRDFTFLHL